MIRIIQTGSTGNAVLYHGKILVDIGVPYALLKPYVREIQIILLTHAHGDHLNIVSLLRLTSERPSLRIGCCEWMSKYVEGFRNVDIYKTGVTYDYGDFKISPVKLYHDIDNCGYRIFRGETKILHCTDTEHLDGIEAKDYDIYALEHNYDEDTIYDHIAYLESQGKFPYMKGSINSHLSEQQARDFFYKNKGDNSQLIRLHETRYVQ